MSRINTEMHIEKIALEKDAQFDSLDLLINNRDGELEMMQK